VDRGSGVDPFAGLKEDSREYTVYDSHYEKLGKVDDLVLGEDDRVLYVGVKTGLLGTNSTLVPVEIIRVNDKRQLIEISEPADTVKHAPHFGRNEDLTPELENHVRTYFGLDSLTPSPEHEPQGPDILEPLSGHSGSEYWVDTVPIYHIEAEEDQESIDREPREAGIPERVESRENEPRRPASEEPTGERPGDQTEGRWESSTSGSGVTVHRPRR
jgi:hypothetical protein